MTLTATFPWANLATATGPARVDTPAFNAALPCLFSTRPGSDASRLPPRTATFLLQQPSQRTRSNRAEMAAITRGNRYLALKIFPPKVKCKEHTQPGTSLTKQTTSV